MRISRVEAPADCHKSLLKWGYFQKMFSLAMMSEKIFFFGDWQINPSSNSVCSGETTRTLEPKAMDVLMLLCQQANTVVSTEDILNKCWGGADLGDNPIHKVINQLRKALGDETSNPNYIETIRKRGYRTLAPVVFPLGYEEVVEEEQWNKGSPFPGLRAFKETDASVFFGRGEQITALLKAISTQVRSGHALNIVLGPSGSGKTSLVNAGIIPNLLANHGFDGLRVCSAASVDMADINEDRLFIDLASTLLDWVINEEPVFANISAEILAQELQNRLDKIVNLFTSVMTEKATQSHYQLLLIDRIEVLLSAPQFSDQTRRHVVRIMEKFARSGAAIVIATCRNDLYPTLAQHQALMNGKSTGAHFDLLPPTRTELLQMIRLPAKHAQLNWENNKVTSLDQMLCDDAVDNPDALPMLQYTLNELYQQRSEDNVLRLKVYQSLGGIEGAIGKRAEAIVANLSGNVRAVLPSIFAKLVTLSIDEKSVTSRTALWSQLHSEQEQQLVQVLVDNRLLVSHLIGTEPGFSLAHEALLRKWQRAVEWIQQHRDNLKALHRIQIATERWQNEKEAKEFLLPDGKPLFEAKEIQNNRLFALSDHERRFIAQSNKRSDFRKTIRRTTIALLSVLTILSIITTWRSIESEEIAQRERSEAESLLGFMVGDFADKLRSIGRMDLLDGVSTKALEYFSKGIDQRLSATARYQHAQTLSAIGEVSYSRGKRDEARVAFTSSQDRLQKLNEENPEDFATVKSLGASFFWLGQIAFDVGQWDLSEKLLNSYRRHCERLIELQPSNTESLIELSYANNSLGTLFLKRRNYSAAREYFESSLALKSRALSLQQNNVALRADRADTLSWIASTLLSLGDATASLKLHEEEQKELENIKRSSANTASVNLLLANSLRHQANVHSVRGALGIATELNKRALYLMEQSIAEDPENIQWKFESLQIQGNLIRLRSLTRNMAVQIDQESLISTALTLVASEPDSHSAKWFMVKILKDVAFSYYHSGDFSRSLISTEKSLLELNILSNQNPDNTEYLLAEGELLLLRAKLFRANNNINQEHEYCSKTINVLSSLVKTDQSPFLLIPLVQAKECLGESREESKYAKILDAQKISEYAYH